MNRYQISGNSVEDTAVGYHIAYCGDSSDTEFIVGVLNDYENGTSLKQEVINRHDIIHEAYEFLVNKEPSRAKDLLEAWLTDSPVSPTDKGEEK